jgi:hypothetical protein
MSDYWFRVYVDRVICRDTESLHSSDKFALAGVVMTDLNAQGFVMPMIRINDGETRRYDEDLNTIFDAASSEPKVGIALLGWDLDQNDSWVENKEDIIDVSQKISEGVKMIPEYGAIAGSVLDAAIVVVPPIIDQFADWDKNDKLLDYRQIVNGNTGNAYQEVSKSLSVVFSRDDSIGYSDWDYTLDLTIYCTWMPSFGTGGIQLGEQAGEQPYQNSVREVWLGVWDGADIVVEIQPSSAARLMDVTVTETDQNRGGYVFTTLR